MVVLEAWPPVRGAQECLEGAGEVNEAVTHEEEHGEDGRDVVQVADQDGQLTDA